MVKTASLVSVLIATTLLGYAMVVGVFKWYYHDYTWVVTLKQTDGTIKEFHLKASNLSAHHTPLTYFHDISNQTHKPAGKSKMTSDLFLAKYSARSESIVLKNHKTVNLKKQVVHPPVDVNTEMTVDKFMKEYSARSKKNAEFTRTMCRKYRDAIPKRKTNPNILVNEEHKLVYCQTPKVATVSWCKIFLILTGYKNYSEVVKMSSPKVSAAWKIHVPRLRQFSAGKQEEIMTNYTKIMFVRNPMTRLLSAYNDKLVAKNASDFKLHLQQKLSQAIIKRVRSGNTTGKYDLTFGEFVKMLVSEHPYRNVHWGTMYSTCNPCDINYDVIGRLEDIENDSNYILRRVGANVTFPKSTGTHFTNSSSRDKVKKSYATIPDSELKALYRKYLLDFLLFGYEKGIPDG